MKAGSLPASPALPVRSASPRLVALAGAFIVLAGVAAYHNSFSGPFVLDDPLSIAGNPSIRHFASALHPPPDGRTVTGRPVLNLSLAFNYARGGTDVRGYHVVNLIIHLLAGLALFGIVRRTLARFRREATFTAFLAALLWTVHPLQTEAVTYVVQRAESLMGLFYLLTIYCFIRGAEIAELGTRNQMPDGRGPRIPIRSAHFGLWFLGSVLFCLLGMGTKEVMVSAPLMVLLYDRTFVSGNFGQSWRQRRVYYLALTATWLPLGWLVASSHSRNNTAGLGVAVSWWQYAPTQFPAIVGYLELAAWPARQIFDYGATRVDNLWAVLPDAALVVALGVGSLIALRRRPVWGFFGFWFFAILAPGSAMPSVRQTVAEHRMYLALAPLAVAGALLFARLGKRGWWAGLVLAAGLVWLTVLRNNVYRSDLALWTDTVSKAPYNAFAQHNLGLALFDHNRPREAEAHYRAALQLNPNLPDTHNNLGVVLALAGKLPEAVAEYEETLRLKPDYADAYNNLGFALEGMRRPAEAVVPFEQALRLKPDYAEAMDGLGVALTETGRAAEAIAQFKNALQLKPDYAEAESGLGVALADTGRTEEAIAHYERALQLNPAYADAHNNLGSALMKLGRLDEAEKQFEAALQTAPDNPQMRVNLAAVFARTGRLEEAIKQYENAVQLDPSNAKAQNDLAIALIRSGRGEEATAHFREAVRLEPDRAIFHANLGNALVESGRINDAIAEYRAALQIDPTLTQIRGRLERLTAQPAP